MVKALKQKQKDLQKGRMREFKKGGTPSPPLHLNGIGHGPTALGGSPLLFGPNLHHQMQTLLQHQLLTPSQLQSFMQQQSLLFQHQVSYSIE